ncbi:NUDIX hydrolase [Burkholderia cenocepacia]|uniref:NUDIX hydrolase n=1 Tax=Burkholderia cenocepacia TaxID=95486 RepID=UPI000760D4CA|nr:NUDIX domain-containing protein [Burkholderia cenocepacia]KWU19031.1 hypothetical protein AS149_12345 [Burkholderia cenocepacia]
MQEKTVYVSTLMVNRDFTRAAFILKNRPAFLAGKVCPVGGKVEPGETPRQAAAREHGEETLVVTSEEAWTPYARVERENAVMHCFFTATDDVEACRTNRDEENYEEVHVLNIKDVLAAAVTPGTPGRVATTLLQDEHSVSDDLAALLGLVLRARSRTGFTVLQD